MSNGLSKVLITLAISGLLLPVTRAEFFSAHTQPERAIHDYETAISLKYERSEVYEARANAYLDTSQFANALDDYAKAIKLRLDRAEPYKGRGVARAALGQYRDAI